MIRRRFVLGAALAAALGASPLHAQDRIPLRLAPRPEQVILTTTSQHAEMQIEGTPVSITSSSKMVTTQKVGPRTADGGLELVLTVDQFDAEALMNGQPAPLPIPALTNHTFTITYDDASNVVTAVKPGDPADESVTSVIRAMMEQLYQQSDRTIAIGESVAVPMNRMIAMGGVGGGAPTNGQMTLTLTAIDREEGDRIARFDQQIDASTAPDPTGPAISTKMTGTGTASWNLDRGYVTASEMALTLDGEMMQAKLHGTLTLKITGSN